jgi:hypothetical protein
MLRGYWCSIIKVAGISLLLFAGYAVFSALSWHSTSLENEAAQRTKIHGQNAENRIERVCISPLAKPDCVEEARQAQRENEREEQDLAAQKVTAWWTKVMGIAALIGMALSAVGVWLVKTTFDETRKANDIARDANRPWVSITVVPKAFRLRSKGFFEFDVILKNVGGSAAVNLNFVADATFGHLHKEDVTDIVWKTTLPQVPDSKVVLLPGGDHSHSYYKLIEFERDKLLDNRSEATFDPIITICVFYKCSPMQEDWNKTVQSFVLRRSDGLLHSCNSYEVVVPMLVAIPRSGMIAT